MAAERPNIWKTGAFCALLADPLVENNSQVPEVDLATSIAVVELLLQESPLLKLKWGSSPLAELVAPCRELLQVKVDDSEKFAQFILVFLQKLGSLEQGGVMMVPAGWIGSTTRSSLVIVIENAQNGFNFTVCNAGEGVNYHPCKVDGTKIKYVTCLPIRGVPRARALDRAFWTSMFSQFMKPSEFHRVEVLYDVLFPWLCNESSLVNVIDVDDKDHEYRTPVRAGMSSPWRNLIEGIRYYLMHHYGCSKQDMKEFSTLLKCEMLATSLKDLQDPDREKPNSDEQTLIRMGCQTVAHSILKLKIGDDQLDMVKQLVKAVEDALNALAVVENESSLVGFDTTGLSQEDSTFKALDSMLDITDQYAGAAEEPHSSPVVDILQVPTRKVDTIEEAVAALVKCESVCIEISGRAEDGSSFSSRMALQLQIVEMIGSIWTRVIPIPIWDSGTCMWHKFPSKDLQLTTLKLLHRLTLMYAKAWQSFEDPTRAFDSERSVVALSFLCAFDCTLRHNAYGLECTSLLNEDGGYCVSTAVCVANLGLIKVAATMELHRPRFAIARSACLSYLETAKNATKYQDLFNFRMPTDKIEIKKYGTSVLFLRKLMERCGYELVPRENPEPPPEIESLLEWMTSPSSDLAKDHPEYGMLRDMACLVKFLSTMEDRESELRRQRIAPTEYMSWGLSFEDTSMEASAFTMRRTGVSGLRWEVLNYRGLDLDTADVQVTGFGDRKLFFGEGSVVHSPCDVQSLVNQSSNKRITEDDILHADRLPNFGDTLSRQESEVLLSYLTVPYIRIPMVLSFFAAGDRVTYLFNFELQALLRAVIFDASDWAVSVNDKIGTVPIVREATNSVLGTCDGLLMNELRHSPDGTLRPLLKMLQTLDDLSQASVYSPDAALTLYLMELALDVQSFIHECVSDSPFEAKFAEVLTKNCRSILKHWLEEAMTANDIETSCVIHSYLALIWTSLKREQYDMENISEMMGSLCFVRNWHGFGLSEPLMENSNEAPPEQRLMRFMQAHGVDTSRVAKGSLQKYIGSERPLYLRIGARTFKVPNLSDSGLSSKPKLVAVVPEQKLLALLQEHRMPLVSYLDSLKGSSEKDQCQSFILHSISQIALNTSNAKLDVHQVALRLSQSTVWSREARGCYKSPDQEMTLDIQGAQVMWRNDELKPLPDSMTQFNDFHVLFGKKQLHCGVVANQQHRQWVHVVGTEYDLLLWDEPTDIDQGIVCPVDSSVAPTVREPTLFWNCGVCTFMNQNGGESCEMCGQSRTSRNDSQPTTNEGDENKLKGPSAIEYLGIRYFRHLDPFAESYDDIFSEDEGWVLKLLVPALNSHYKDQMNYRVLLPEHITTFAMACITTEHEVEDERRRTRTIETSTWKQFVLNKKLNMVSVFNFVSHGRRMFKQLVYCSNSKLALHALQPSSSVFGACGDLKAILTLDPSLLITRNISGDVETLVPSRLLFGVVPSALLESYQFWHNDTDGFLRGDPLDLESQWFGATMIEIDTHRNIYSKSYVKREMKRTSTMTAARRMVVDSSSAGSSIEFDETQVLTLCGLGFTPAACRLALSKCSGNSAFAAEWLLNPENEFQIATADSDVLERDLFSVVYHGEVAIRNMPLEEDGYHSNRIGSLHFGEECTVLQRAGDWLRIEFKLDSSREAWVLSTHPTKGRMLKPVLFPGDLTDEPSLNREAVEQLQQMQSKMDITEEVSPVKSLPLFKLVNLLDGAAVSNKLFDLLTLLIRVEDVSHVLVWASVEDEARIESIELPRLKLRIKPAGGKLHLVDHAGWFILGDIPSKLLSLLDAHTILLMNDKQELQFLIPNHQVARPSIKGKPFSVALRCDRGSFSWLQTMDTRYFLFPVHTSLQFLIIQELGASIYLVLLKLLQRRYSEAFKLIPNCTVDVPFSPDEGYIWNQLAAAEDDWHPDAHACRLKLSLAVMYAKNSITTPWENHTEFDRYLAKQTRVSCSCRLSMLEEKKVSRLVRSATPLIKNRVAMLRTPPTELRSAVPRVGGSPWSKLQRQTDTYLDNHATSMKRVHFKPRVSGEADAFLTDVIFSDHVVADEESGANRQLGFVFVMQLLNQPMEGDPLRICPFSLGGILARHMHLKLSRWGKETVAEGEVESSNSRHMAQLAAMAAGGAGKWPEMPTDAESTRQLQSGLNLYTDAGRRSGVKLWLDLIDVEFKNRWKGIFELESVRFRAIGPHVLKEYPNYLDFSIQPAMILDTDMTKHVGYGTEVPIEKPLESIARHFVHLLKSTDSVPAASLPFDLSGHSSAKSAVASEILERLSLDVKGYSQYRADLLESQLKQTTDDAIGQMIIQLETVIRQDNVFVLEEIEELERLSNAIADSNYQMWLHTFALHREPISFNLLTQALMSSCGADTLRKLNPTLTDWEQILVRVPPVLVRTNRISQANRCVSLAKELLKGDHSCRISQMGKTLAENLNSSRYFVEQDGSFDPRFLVFEYVFDILLRQRQVEIVRSFVQDMEQGQSHVQQMIMGAGKTTVVAPLLTLLLADGKTLVTQVMPTALLEQTRHVMRSRFSVIISKRVFTLEFDRSCADSPDVAREVYDKLEEARDSRSVVCASPDAIKSLSLKFIEHMHSIQSVDAAVLKPSSSLRQNKEIVQLRDTMQNRCDMADALVPIFDMWKSGVLIMDEVDVLLHPLRSELNFPIGLKNPIDMSGFRWSLPTHLLSAFFFAKRLLVEDDEKLRAALKNIGEVVETGYQSHALQRNPHLVLLDESFYREKLMEPLAVWCIAWIQRAAHNLPDESVLVRYLMKAQVEAGDLECESGEIMKMLNLSRDWIRTLLPHVLSKIDRVSFGILSPMDLNDGAPLSRRLMAVPFVGKDVPSRSSEFAHPDVVIGLTILAYRYEGLRAGDVKTIVTQLKSDFTRQVGPRDQRPATKLFRSWLEAAKSSDNLPVLPLPLFQVGDPKQLQVLFELLRNEDTVISYYLHQHVFPACMNFQSIKISACGHELGSNILFNKRIGFSGTPSNLLPRDLGECMYEPGSDGLVIHVLSSPDVVSIENKNLWTAKSLLRDIASSNVHALIDTGALITGMGNEQVAAYLLEHLPLDKFEGVVYIDRSDRKMMLQRSSGRSLHLSQCGVNPKKRFTFYDQVHTTGMDISQASDAVAVVTIGKDMTFRDYAQGTFRMRGIGKGQSILVYLIPEVKHLIQNELDTKQSCTPLDIMAWLLINSLKMESIQFSMLSLQELLNCWRKEALGALLEDCRTASIQPRLLRFLDERCNWLVRCIDLFRETVGFHVPSIIPSVQSFHDRIDILVDSNKHFIRSPEIQHLVQSVAGKVRQTGGLCNEELGAEIVNENEQEQQEEQEEEAEEEQEKVSQFVRDDEQLNPWNVAYLNQTPSCTVGEEPFYRMNSFRVRDSQPTLPYAPSLLLSDNWFRPRWIGLGDRRLKNVMVVLEWNPLSFNARVTRLVPKLHQSLISQGIAPNIAAVKAFAMAVSPANANELAQVVKEGQSASNEQDTFHVAVSLAEAETLRKMLHTVQVASLSDFALVSVEDGMDIDKSPWYMVNDEQQRSRSLACFKFMNSDMHFSYDDLSSLLEMFSSTPISDRIKHFEDCLRLRRREKFLWGDTPLAKLFTEESEWHLLKARATLQQISHKLQANLRRKRRNLLQMFSRADSDNDGSLSHADLQKLLEDLQLGFSPADIALVVQLVSSSDGLISWERLVTSFKLPDDLADIDDDVQMEVDSKNDRWQCSNCTFINFASDLSCDVCGYGWSGEIVVPNGKWMCDPVYGGCTFFNHQSSFYCEMCNRSKPSLQSMRF